MLISGPLPPLGATIASELPLPVHCLYYALVLGGCTAALTSQPVYQVIKFRSPGLRRDHYTGGRALSQVAGSRDEVLCFCANS